MATWKRKLTRPEITEAVKAHLVREGEMDPWDDLQLAPGITLLEVTIEDREKPTEQDSGPGEQSEEEPATDH